MRLTTNDSLEYNVKEMVRSFLMNVTIKKSDNINEAVWENKEEFAEVVLNEIWEYMGEEGMDEIFEELKEDDSIEFDVEDEEEGEE